MPAHEGIRPDYSQFNENRVALLETVTGPPAVEMLKQARLLPNLPANTTLLDNASGAGCVAGALFQALERDGIGMESLGGLKIVCGDIEPKMVESLTHRIQSKGWGQVVEGRKVDASITGFPDNHFTHVLMNFGPQIIPDPASMCRETLRILRPSGTAGFTSWARVGWLASLQATFPSFILPPPLAKLWTKPNVISKDLADLGYKDIVITPFIFKTKSEIPDFMDMLTNIAPFLKEAESKQKYEACLKEQADAVGQVEMEWEALIVTAKK